MAQYQATVNSPLSIDDAFDYLADFSSVREWDPSVTKAEALGPKPPALGSRFHVVTRFMGSDTELDYEIVEIERPRLVVLRAETPALVSLDRISFRPIGTGSRVVYDADLRLKGARRAFELPLRVAFRRLGDNARDGLAEALSSRD